jgi:hypothetical protein
MGKLQTIKNTLSLTMGKTGLVLKKFSPEILMVSGVVGIVGSTVLACRATLKVDEVLDGAKENLEKIKATHEKANTPGEENEYFKKNYTDKDYKKDLAIQYKNTAIDLVKLYGPAVTLGLVSIGFILGSHGIMKKRNVALVAAYKTVEDAFAKYRKRVVEEYGEEKDRDYITGTRRKVVEEVNEKGKKTGKTTEEVTIDPNAISVYAKYFDKSSINWSETAEYNRMFLQNQQNYANDLLHSRGHVFLNEVYDALGIPRSSEGAVVGWVMGHGDDFIDFGIFNDVKAYANDHDNETVGEKRRDFVNGYGKACAVLLDFNVDGVIYDLI